MDKFEVKAGQWVLDPFCGTGTTLVECRKREIPSVGTEAHPALLFASEVKINWHLDTAGLRYLARKIIGNAETDLENRGLPAFSSFDADLVSDAPRTCLDRSLRLTEEEERILPGGFLSARPLTRLLALRGAILDQTVNESKEVTNFFLLALANVTVTGAGNFAFGPEIYRTRPKADYDVIGHFARHINGMIGDLEVVRNEWPSPAPCYVYQDDARVLSRIDIPVAAVITSPPYPNEKDYTRTTRVESILLGLIRSKAELRATKESLLRSNTRNVFKNDKDADYIADVSSVKRVCREIESRREELGKTSGFERLYHRVVAHYFGGMRRHFRALYPKLLPGARCAYVVGDQLSFLMVPVPTADLLAEIAQREGFRVVGCDLWRERVGTKIRNASKPMPSVRVREYVLLLEKPRETRSR